MLVDLISNELGSSLTQLR